MPLSLASWTAGTLPVSQHAVDLIESFEVGDTYDSTVSWPGGASGLTIGVGYDLGYATVRQIADDWSALPASVVVRLQSYAGRTGQAAQTALFATRDIVIPQSVAEGVFGHRDIPRYSDLTATTFQNCDQLSPDSFGALVSLVFNRGASMVDPKAAPGSRLEMRQIRDAMAAGHFALVPACIRSMKRVWVGKGLDGLLARRDAEAALFEAGLGQVAAPIPPPANADDLNNAEFTRITEYP